MPVILVVEDDQLMLKAIGNILHKGGFNVHNAQNGKEALEMLDSTCYDVVITDLMMPFAGGMEVVSHIRSDSSRKNTCVIVVSSMAQEEMVTEAFNLGADDFLKKPVMAGELVSRIRKLLVRRNLPGDSMPDIEHDAPLEDIQETLSGKDITEAGTDSNLDAMHIPEGRYTIAINKFINKPGELLPKNIPPDNVQVPPGEEKYADVSDDIFTGERIFSSEVIKQYVFSPTYPPVIKVGNLEMADLPVKVQKGNRFSWVVILVTIVAVLALLLVLLL